MKTEEIIFWALFALGIMAIIWIFLGNSPTLEQALLVLMLAMLIKNSSDVREIRSDLRHPGKGFNALAYDFRAHVGEQD